MLTLRDRYWKTHPGGWESLLQQPTDLCSRAAGHPWAIPVPAMTALQLRHCTFQSGKPAAVKLVPLACGLIPLHPLLTPLSWSCLILAFGVLHSPALSHVLYF